MKVEYLNNIVENCYKDEHLSENFTNAEQINICKHEQQQAVFGKFDNMLINHRESDNIRLMNCLDDAGADPGHAVRCMDQHIKNIRSTNESMKAIFKNDYGSYMWADSANTLKS